MAYIVFFPYQICQVDHKKSSPLHIGKNLYPTLGTLNKLIYQSMKPIDEQIEKKYLQLKLYLLWPPLPRCRDQGSQSNVQVHTMKKPGQS